MGQSTQGANLLQQLGNDITGGIGGAIGMGISDLMQPFANENQLNQQQALTNMQLAANQQLSSYNFEQQYELWQKTNYPAQVQELEEAGLNPALLYAKGGPGGTTGAPTTGMGMGIAPGQSPAQTAQALQQQELTNAQIQNINADTKKKEAETPTTGNIADTSIANTQALTNNIKQLTSNAQVQQIGQNIQNQLNQIQLNVNTKTQGEQIIQLQAQSETAFQQMRQAAIAANIADQTKQQLYTQICTATIQAQLNLEATQAGIQLTREQTSQAAANIANMAIGQQQGWKKLSQQQQEIQIQQQLANFGTNTAAHVGQWTGAASRLAQTVSIFAQ